MEPTIIRADSTFRRRWLLVAVPALIVLGIGVYFIDSHVTNLASRTDPSSGALDVRALLLFAGAAILLTSIPLFLQGWKVIRSQQYPLSGAKVLVDTPVTFGRRAMLNGYLLLLLGCFFVVVAVSTISTYLVLRNLL